MKRYPIALLLLLIAADVLAATATCKHPCLGSVVKNVNSELDLFGKLLEMIATTTGFIFGIISLFKLKAHRDNQQQTTITVPMVWFLCGVCLVSVSQLFGAGISTIYGGALSDAGLVRPPPEKEKAYGPAARL